MERKGASGSYTLVGTTASTSLIDSGVSNGSAYLFKVCAADGAGNWGLANASWTNAAATGDTIYAADVTDVRTALDLALTTLNIPTSAYTDNQLAGAPNGTTIKRAHLAELRERATSGVVESGGGGASNVSWTNVSSTIQATGNSLMKVSGTNDWNAGAVSTQTISGDGYVEFTAGTTGTSRMCGLGNGDSSVSYTDIEYAFYLEGSGNLYIYESGNYRGQFGTYTHGSSEGGGGRRSGEGLPQLDTDLHEHGVAAVSAVGGHVVEYAEFDSGSTNERGDSGHRVVRVKCQVNAVRRAGLEPGRDEQQRSRHEHSRGAA